MHILVRGLLRRKGVFQILASRKLQLLQKTDVRNLRISTILLNNEEEKERAEFFAKFTPVYKMPTIQYMGILSKLKIHTLAGTGIGGLVLYVLEQIGMIDTDVLLSFLALGGLLSVPLVATSILSYKLVGFIYLSKMQDTAVIAYLSFWGGRRNEQIPIEDLMALSDLPSTITDPIYYTLRRYSNDDTFKLSLQQGIVLDQEKFNFLFSSSKGM